MAAKGTETRVYTIDDIAKELGVSKTTVSRAISGKGRLSAETRARVLAFIAEHNYRPNAVAKGLAQSKTYNLGLVLPGDYEDTELPFFQECMAGICEVALENDYDVLISMVTGSSTTQLERAINNHKVDGVIVSRSTVNSPVVALLKETEMPFVVVGAPQDPEVLYVDNDNQGACRGLTTLLFGKGMRRLALLGGDETHSVTGSRFRGYQEAHQLAGQPLQKDLVFKNISTVRQAGAAVDEALWQQVDCLICMDDYICNLALVRLRELALHIPQDIRMASFYDSNLLKNNNPPITSLRFDTKELGKMACQMLLYRMAGKETQNRTCSGYQILLRDSTK